MLSTTSCLSKQVLYLYYVQYYKLYHELFAQTSAKQIFRGCMHSDIGYDLLKLKNSFPYAYRR